MFKPIKEVFILGAGISKDCDFPIVNDLLSEEYITFLVNNFPPEDGWTKAYREKGKDYLIQECRYFKSFDKNIEEIFTIFFESNDLDNQKRIASYLNAILYIAKESCAYNSEKSEYFFRFISRVCTHPFVNPSFITFNYDLQIERAIKMLEFFTKTKLVNYGNKSNNLLVSRDFSNKINLTGSDVLPPYNGSIPVLKLHGSLNWGKCYGCSKITIFPKEIIEFMGSSGITPRCDNCGKVIETPFIIPPSKEKENIELKWIWDKAGDLIMNADLVSIIGYSMPIYDELAYQLIKKNCNLNPESKKKITILNKYIDEDAKKRFQELGNEIKFIETGFKDYVL